MQQRYSGRFVTATVAMTFIIQAFTSFAMSVPAVIAPVAAADLGFAPGSVGVLVSSAYVAAILLGLAGGPLITRFGPVRLFQFAAFLDRRLCERLRRADHGRGKESRAEKCLAHGDGVQG